jgi:predicted alpha/beta-hydrolase family hydrolase
MKALLLTPGAGSDRDHRCLVAIDDLLTADGAVVRRVDFPYRRAGRRAPDRAPVLLECIRQEAQALCDELAIRPSELALGGRSMGGRICSMAVASGLVAAGGLVLISYPLHPPGKPERLRVEHLPDIHVPVLAISGTRDSFGTPTELEAAFAQIPSAVTTHWIERGTHELKGVDVEVAETVSQWWKRQVPAAARRRRPRG